MHLHAGPSSIITINLPILVTSENESVCSNIGAQNTTGKEAIAPEYFHQWDEVSPKCEKLQTCSCIETRKLITSFPAFTESYRQGYHDTPVLSEHVGNEKAKKCCLFAPQKDILWQVSARGHTHIHTHRGRGTHTRAHTQRYTHTIQTHTHTHKHTHNSSSSNSSSSNKLTQKVKHMCKSIKTWTQQVFFSIKFNHTKSVYESECWATLTSTAILACIYLFMKSKMSLACSWLSPDENKWHFLCLFWLSHQALRRNSLCWAFLKIRGRNLRRADHAGVDSGEAVVRWGVLFLVKVLMLPLYTF